VTNFFFIILRWRQEIGIKKVLRVSSIDLAALRTLRIEMYSLFGHWQDMPLTMKNLKKQVEFRSFVM
jgi:hypothetical protein